MQTLLASVVLTAAVFAGAQDKAPFTYKFTKGETLKYDFTSDLESNLKGSDAAFTVDGEVLSTSTKGTIELLTKEVAEDGTAVVERILKNLTATGEVVNKKLKYTYSSEKAEKEAKPEDDKSMEAALYQSCRRQVIYSITSAGQLTGIPNPEGFPVEAWIGAEGRTGMMYWPVTGETTDSWAAPVFHDKVHFKCTNEIKKASQIKSKLEFSHRVAELEKRPAFLQDVEFDITVSGEAVINLDLATGKLQSGTLNLKMTLSGKRPDPNGGPDAILKGEATYKETVTRK